MSLLSEYDLARDGAFVARVSMAVVRAAIAIGAESTAGQTAGYTAARQAEVTRVLASVEVEAARFAPAVVAALPDPAAVTDAAISTAVAAVWDRLAGARAGS